MSKVVIVWICIMVNDNRAGPVMIVDNLADAQSCKAIGDT